MTTPQQPDAPLTPENSEYPRQWFPQLSRGFQPRDQIIDRLADLPEDVLARALMEATRPDGSAV